MKSILFVCLGNICRSPMAEGAFLHLINEKGLAADFYVDSAGTAGYHVGERPDKRMIQTAEKHGVYLPSRARKFVKEDFERFDFIVVMDESNLHDVLRLKNDTAKATVLKMREFDDIGRGGDVPDPYYGGMNGFEEVYEMLMRCNDNFIEYLKNKNE
ncbi:MAG: low molecular weight phosphotyrosine protein phosphatase [Flavobacteriales bacterium]|nr:low molecular weight phosphotyrosine protein phosphatase [Flavobacteriales bacterium]